MLRSSSKKRAQEAPSADRAEEAQATKVVSKKKSQWWPWVLLLPAWTYAAFWLAQLIVLFVQEALLALNVPLASINQIIYTTVASVIIYVLALVIAIGVPKAIWKRRTSKKELGVSDMPAWLDILLSVPAYIVYVVCSGIVVLVVAKVLPGVDLAQQQELPFSQTLLGAQWQYMLAFFTLVILAPLAEELLFRGYLYGKLRNAIPAWAVILVTGLTFGLAHLWTGPGNPLQWAVMFDTLTLGIMLGLLREYTGAIWAGVLVHAIKNGIAFYFLFLNPDVLEQLKSAVLPLL